MCMTKLGGGRIPNNRRCFYCKSRFVEYYVIPKSPNNVVTVFCRITCMVKYYLNDAFERGRLHGGKRGI